MHKVSKKNDAIFAGLALIGIVASVVLIVKEGPAPLGGDTLPLEVVKATTTVRSMLLEKTSDERASIKGQEIAKIGSTPKERVQFSGADYQIEIVDINAIEGGVEVFARAWTPQGEPIGFADGSVEIERFRIFNPPILVDDPNGTITRVEETGPRDVVTGEIPTTIRTLREDPKEALLQTLSHTISLVGKTGTKIEAGKVGNTTDTYYPNADAESTSVDGSVYMDANNDTWANTRNAATGGGANDSNTTIAIYVGNWLSGTNRYWIYRGAFLFDTSAISDTDTIDSATVSFWPTTTLNDDLLLTNKSFRLVASTPASDTAIVAADYDQFGTTAGATDIAITSITTGSYSMVYTLNATGLTWVSKTGITKLGVRHTADTNDEEPDAPGAADDYNYLVVSSADNAGTTQDPKLVVVHSAPPTKDPGVPHTIIGNNAFIGRNANLGL